MAIEEVVRRGEVSLDLAMPAVSGDRQRLDVPSVPRTGFVSPFCVYVGFYALLLSTVLVFVCLWFPKMMFVTPMWPKLGSRPPFLWDFLHLGSWIFPLSILWSRGNHTSESYTIPIN